MACAELVEHRAQEQETLSVVGLLVARTVDLTHAAGGEYVTISYGPGRVPAASTIG